MSQRSHHIDPRREHVRRQAVQRREMALERVANTRGAVIGGVLAATCAIAVFIDTTAPAHPRSTSVGIPARGSVSSAGQGGGGGSHSGGGGSGGGSGAGSSGAVTGAGSSGGGVSGGGVSGGGVSGGGSSSQSLLGGGAPPSSSSGGGVVVSGGS